MYSLNLICAKKEKFVPLNLLVRSVTSKEHSSYCYKIPIRQLWVMFTTFNDT